MKRQLGIIGIVSLLVAIFLCAISIVSETVKAESAAGTWRGTCTDQAGAADFHFDVVLELSGESSLSGTISLTCTSVDVKISGFEDSQNMVGTITTGTVEGTMSGSSLTLYVSDDYGCTYTFYMEVSGNTMTGSGQYEGAAGETDYWTFGLSSSGGIFGGAFGSIDMSSLETPAAALAAFGGSASIAAAFSPAPRSAGGGGGRSQRRSVPTIRRGAAVIRSSRPFQLPRRRPAVQAPPPQPQPVQPPQPQQPPLRNPAETLNMPTQRQPTTGPHLVPWDAPQQCPPTANPQGYPYKDGTSASMRCPYCGCTTLSPFTTGWYCTNPLCPARREKLQRGYTHHQYNDMTWRP
jgi:hypothetical protein